MAVRTKAKRQITRKVVPAVAPGPALGFGLQETLITHRLLSAPAGTSLSLELLDDVATHQGGAPQELIQSASTLGSNPAADRHPKLWKTLYNWITAIHELDLDPSSINFVLYVSAPVGGALVDALAAAHDSPSALSAVAAARDELWGPAPNYHGGPECVGADGHPRIQLDRPMGKIGHVLTDQSRKLSSVR